MVEGVAIIPIFRIPESFTAETPESITLNIGTLNFFLKISYAKAEAVLQAITIKSHPLFIKNCVFFIEYSITVFLDFIP